jgi:AraC-like DNA-binding protein
MTRKDTQLIVEIREYLDENLYDDHSIQSLCRQFTINREKLQAGFHALVQSTVHAYIVRQRIERAARRLIESDDSIKAIALDSGYRKQRSFNKTFKATYHLTPASYRRVHQKN